MKSILKKIGLGLLFIFLILQFIRPDKNESGYETIAYFENETKPTSAIKAILKNNCYDCHSNQTVYPWYAQITPISYWLADHIKDGKKHFNVSDWQQYSVKKKDHKLDELIEEVEKDEMPLSSYTWIHGNLNSEEKEVLLSWTRALRKQYVEK